MKYSLRNIIIFSNGSIGDFLMTLYFLDNVHKNDDSIKLTVAVPRNTTQCKELAQAYPFVHVLELNRRTTFFVVWKLLKKGVTGIVPITIEVLPLATRLVARFVTLLPSSQLVGFSSKGLSQDYFFDRLVPFDEEDFYYKNLQRLLGVLHFSIIETVPSFKYTATAGPVLKKLAILNTNYVVLHPFGSNPKRSILEEELTWMVKTILRLDPNVSVVISGSSADHTKIPHDLLCIDRVYTSSKLTFQELSALLKQARFYVGVDTGVTHLASILGCFSLVIAHSGNLPWLPYYNERATVVYAVLGDTSKTYEGLVFLRQEWRKKMRCLSRVPRDVIESYLKDFLKKR